MTAGRPRTPDAVKRLKGNPRKEKLPDTDVPSLPDVLAPAMAEIEPPAWLTHPREIEIFRMVMGEFVPKNIARATDYAAYARYAVFLHKFIAAKELTDQKGGDGWYETDSSNGAGGVKMLRRFPGITDMLDFADKCDKMEAQLGLTPMSRQSILARMRIVGGLQSNAPGLPLDAPQAANEGTDTMPESPLGFLADVAAASPAKN